jgi:D-glycero-alpha-D-manno-heptose-7-phosphate kinase
MIITRTPYRISFFGGGTDHPAWYREHGGKVLATTFNKYCHISVGVLPRFFEHKYRVVYSQIETINNINEIQHPSVRETLKYFKCKQGLKIHHDGDLPARSGLGSSSSFTVGMVNAMHALNGRYSSSHELASSAIHIEQNLIKECVGSQDQISAAYGGFNEIEFYKDGGFSVEPISAKKERLDDLNNHLMLFFTKISRFSSDVSMSQISNIDNCYSQMNELQDMVDVGSSILKNINKPIEQFGSLLDQAWKTKRSLSKLVSNNIIDDVYKTARNNGAIGGKVLGAGGGGFILFFVKPQDQEKVKTALNKLIHVPFLFENTGSKVIINQPNGY